MPFDWQEYLQLARALAAYEPTDALREAALRSAVSRAYFAAFCRARNHERERRGFVPKGVGDHGRLKNHLRTTGRRRHASLLAQLQIWREQCDYDGE